VFQMTLLALVGSFLVGACLTAIYSSRVVNEARKAAAEAEATVQRDRAHAYQRITNLEAELRESQQATADQAMRANKLMAENRRLSKR
jgi:hypothetical protein